MSLIPRVLFGDLDLTDYPYSILIDEGDDGVAANVYQDIDSALRDGQLVTSPTTDNREITRTVMVEGTDLYDVAESAAALGRECDKQRNALTLDPGDGFAPSAVYETFRAQIVERRSRAMDEANVRLFDITWPAVPFARSVDPFTVSGVTSGATPTTVVINEATSVTGWFGQDVNGARYTPGQSGSEVFVDALNGYGQPNPSLVYAPASPVDLTGTQYLSVLWRAADGATPTHNPASVKATADGLSLSSVAVVYEAGGYRNTFVCPDSSVSEFVFTPPSFSGSGTFRIDQIRRTNQAPSTGTLRQKTTSIEVPGSARTPASLSVSHPSSALGQVLVYTSPELAAGYSPALSPYAVGVGSTVTTNVSGKEWSASSGGGAQFDVPAVMLPAGSYQLVARTKRDSAGTSPQAWIHSTASVRFGATEVAGSVVTESVYIDASLTTYSLINLGAFSLPTATVPNGSAATVRIDIAADPTFDLDEAWLFHMPGDNSAHLSQVDCGTGTPTAGGSSNRLWLDAATTDRPYPTALVGTQADRSDSRGVVGEVWDEHLLPAGTNLVFVVTSNALDALVQVDGHARWHTHPAA